MNIILNLEIIQTISLGEGYVWINMFPLT